MFLAVALQPKSLGTVRLRSSDPDEAVECDIAALSDPRDFTPLRAAVRLSNAIAKQMQTDGYPLRQLKGPSNTNSDEELDAYIRKTLLTTFHYTSTCRMAPESDDIPGVVDDELRVHGVAGLRVADSSIFPWIVPGHTQAPTVMVAEKCADMLSRGL